MSPTALDTQIDRLEAQVKELTAGLMGGDPVAMQTGGAALQRLAVELVQMTSGAGRAQFNSPRRMQRIKVLASNLANVRETLLRQMAYVDRALEIVMPVTRDKSTYAGGGGAYGQPVRQSGAFSVLAA